MTSPFKDHFTIKDAPAFSAHIWMAGDYDMARNICRQICAKQGACFSISKTDYIYTGGEESGFTINLINYPRFPSEHSKLFLEAEQLGERLAIELGQGSFTITTSTGATNRFCTRRKRD